MSRRYKIGIVVLIAVMVWAGWYFIAARGEVGKDELVIVAGDGGAAGLTVIVHGWMEGGSDRWAEITAAAAAAKADGKTWAYGYYDWSRWALVPASRAAAKAARDTAGRQLAEHILGLGVEFEHIHLVGHSCGAWVVNEAARELAESTGASIHLTLLDAYVPVGWDSNELGRIDAAAGRLWVEQYYTRDYTLAMTQVDLAHAYNVDITAIDGPVKDHNFPKWWYTATIMGGFPAGMWLHHAELKKEFDGVEYGWGRGLEGGGEAAWRANEGMAVGTTIRLASSPSSH